MGPLFDDGIKQVLSGTPVASIISDLSSKVSGLKLNAHGAPPFTFKDGKLTPGAGLKPATNAQVISQISVLAEASYEYLIGMFSKLQSDDSQSDLTQLQNQLDALKAQKEGLLNNILKETAEIAGKELGGAIQSKKSADAAAKAKAWGFLKAFVLIAVAVIVIIIAVIATPFTGGMSLGLLAGVCAIVGAAITLLTQIPAIMHMVAALFEALGATGLGKDIDAAADWIQNNIMDNPIFKNICLVAQICCAVGSLVCGIGNLLSTTADKLVDVTAKTAEVAEESIGAENLG